MGDRWAVLPPGEERNKKREKVVKILNSLLITSKAGYPIEKLQGNQSQCVTSTNRTWHDFFVFYFPGCYKDIEGERIPFKTIGYSTLEDFLDQGRDFCRIAYDRQGGILIQAVPNEANAHIAHMVSKQRSSSKKKSARAPPRRPAMRMSSGGGTGWMPPTAARGRAGNPYGQMARRMGAINTQSRMGGGRSQGGQRGGANYRHMSASTQQPRPVNSNGYGGGMAQQPQVRRTLSKDTSHSSPPSSSSAADIDPKNKKELLEFCQLHKLESPEFKTAPFNKKFVSVVIVGHERFQTFPKEYNTTEAAEAAASKLALDALKRTVPSLPVSSAPASKEAPATESKAHTAPPVRSSSSSAAVPSLSSHSSSPPASKPNSELELIEERVLALVGDRSNGVWSTQIDVEYKKKHGGQQLPANWARMLLENGGSGRVRVASPIEGRYIVTPVPKSELGNRPPPSNAIKPTAPSQQPPKSHPPSIQQAVPLQPDLTTRPPPIVPQQTRQVLGARGKDPSNMTGRIDRVNGAGDAPPSGSSVGDHLRPPTIKLPPDTDFWNVYITNVNSSTCVFLRLLGEEYSVPYENLVTEMEMHYFNENDFPSISQPQVKTRTSKRIILNSLSIFFYPFVVHTDWSSVRC